MPKEYGDGSFLKRLDIFIKSGFKSRNAFCEKLDISLSTVNGYFSRNSNPSFEFIDKFLSVYSADDLLWLVKGIRTNNTSSNVGETEVYYGTDDPYAAYMKALKDVIDHEVKRK